MSVPPSHRHLCLRPWKRKQLTWELGLQVCILAWKLGLYISILSSPDLADKFLRFICKYNFDYVSLIIKMCHVILIVH